MQGDQTEDERLQILDEVVEYAQALGVRRFGHVGEGANFGRLQSTVSFWPHYCQ